MTQPSDTQRPKITLLSLEKQPWLDEMYRSLFDTIRAKADINEITTSTAADEMFNGSEKPSIILATDASLTTKEFCTQRDAAIRFVRSEGGTLIFGGSFPSFARPPDTKTTFAAFELPCESGDYHRTEFSVNNGCTSIRTTYFDNTIQSEGTVSR